jgi:hypothetical protein
MAFALKPAQPIRKRLKRLVSRQLTRAEASLRHDRADTIHRARTSIKKARAIVGLLREADAGSIKKDERRLRRAAHMLAPFRDADATVATLDKLHAHYPKRLPEHTYAMLRRLLRAGTHAGTDGRARRSLTRAAGSLRAVHRSMKNWRVPRIGRRELASLVTAGYRSSRKAMRRAEDDLCPAELHRWRRRVKALWYDFRLAQGLASPLRKEARRLEQLEAGLGEDHNLTMLQAALAKDADVARRVPAAVREIGAMSTRVQARLRRKAFALGKQLFHNRPKLFARRLRHTLAAHKPRPRKARRMPARTRAS